jgi:prolipoprotein diacylglyceryltransferase
VIVIDVWLLSETELLIVRWSVVCLGLIVYFFLLRNCAVELYAACVWAGAFMLCVGGSAKVLDAVVFYGLPRGLRWGSAIKAISWQSPVSAIGAVGAVAVSILAAQAWTIAFRTGRQKLKVLASAASIGTASTLAVGRLVCLVNGCCYGRPARMGIAVRYPPEFAAAVLYGGHPLHAVQIYDFCLGIVIVGVAMGIWHKQSARSFAPALVLPLLYPVERAITTSWRGDVTHAVLQTVAGWSVLCIVWALGVAGLLIDLQITHSEHHRTTRAGQRQL